MTIQRSTILAGPAIVQWGSATFYTKDDIKITTGLKTFDIATAAYGKVDERLDDVVTQVTFTPAGEWEAAALSALFPYTNPVMGTSMFGATDTTLTIHPLNGLEKIVYAACAVTKMPDIILAATKTTFGAVTLTCLGKDNTAWTDAAKRYTLTGTAAFSDTSFATTNIKTPLYTCAIGSLSTPWDSVKSKEGFTVSFDVSSSPVVTDDEGTADMLLTGVNISVKFAPMGPTLAQVLTLLKIQGTGVTRGISLNSNSNNIVITGAGSGSPIVTVNSCALKSTEQSYLYSTTRHGDLEFVATRTTGSGAMFALTTAT